MVNSGFSGADVTQLRALGARMKVQSSKLREIATSSTVALMAAEWAGNDIDAIRSNWRRSSLPTIDRLADILHDMSVELEGQAHSQEEASGGTTAGSSGSWLDGIRDWFERTLPRFLTPFLGSPSHPSDPSGPQVQPGHVSPDAAEQPARPVEDPEPRIEPVTDAGQAQSQFDSRGTAGVTNSAFGPGGRYDGECTSWVNFRRKELGLEPVPIAWNGGSFYPGSVSPEPTPGAVGSWPAAGDHSQHTFIVESVNDGPPKTMTISEMNNSYLGGKGEVNLDTFTYDEGSGQWTSRNLKTARTITFGA